MGQVTLPPSENIHSLRSDGDSRNTNTPYVYVGGWGKDMQDSGERFNCDLGFQFSCLYRHWVPFANPYPESSSTFPDTVPRRSWIFAKDSYVSGYPYKVHQTITRSVTADSALSYGGFNAKITGPMRDWLTGALTSYDTENVISMVWLHERGRNSFPEFGEGVRFKRSTSIAIVTDRAFGGPSPSYLCGVQWADWKLVRRQIVSGTGAVVESTAPWTLSDCFSVDNSSPYGMYFTKIKTTLAPFSTSYASETVGVEISKIGN
jgi:hypothetical protein